MVGDPEERRRVATRRVIGRVHLRVALPVTGLAKAHNHSFAMTYLPARKFRERLAPFPWWTPFMHER